MRMLVQFGKQARLRFISHLDLQRFMQMALRRTDLPVAYSQGFNPHPVMSFASALAMGWTSEAEILDVKLSEDVSIDRAEREMARALPPDLPLIRARLIPDTHPAMMARLEWAEYRIALSNVAYMDVQAAAERFLAEDSVIAMRKTKSGEKPTDIRPMCGFLRVECEDDKTVVIARLRLTEKATLKPDLLIQTLAEEAEWTMRIHRTALLGLDASGEAASLMEM